MSVNQTGVLFITINRLYLYKSGANDAFALDLPTTCIRDLEVVNKKELANLILGFIDKNQIAPMRLFVALSDAILFQTDIVSGVVSNKQSPQGNSNQQAKNPVLSPEQLLNEIQHYIDSIPFENLSTKTFKTDKGVRVVGANRDLYDAVKEPFETRGFIVEVVAPISVLGKEFATLNTLDRKTGTLILQKSNLIKQNALEIHREIPSLPSEETEKKSTKPDKKKLLMMLSVFGVLVLILIWMVINTFVLSASPQKTAEQPRQTSTAIIPENISPTLSATAAPIEPISTEAANLRETISIEIRNGSGITNQASDLQKQLQEVGYSTIEISTARQTNTERTLAVFKSSVPNQIRNEILDALKKNYSTVSSQQNTGTTFDIVITTGQPL